MAGITDLPFRKICKNLGAGLVVSEMTAANPDTWNSKKKKKSNKIPKRRIPTFSSDSRVLSKNDG